MQLLRMSGLQATEAILEETNGLASKGGVFAMSQENYNPLAIPLSFELYNAG